MRGREALPLHSGQAPSETEEVSGMIRPAPENRISPPTTSLSAYSFLYHLRSTPRAILGDSGHASEYVCS
jgi:hypothetical protein